jgi:uncharacterized protein
MNQRIAVIGSGIAGLAAASRLTQAGRDVWVTLFEAEQRCGGHAHTVDVTLPDAQGRPVTHGVDTGFLVFNRCTYPGLCQLFDELGVETAPSEMSFSVQDRARVGRALEWSGHDLSTVFAQRRNLFSPSFLGMLRDMLRFNREATALALNGSAEQLSGQTIGDFLDERGYGPMFRQGYLLPMIAAIWSCPARQMLAFPLGTLVHFCHNHGLLQITNRPQWYTVAGGSRQYVRKLIDSISEVRTACPVHEVRRTPQNGIALRSAGGTESFDAVVLACHPDQALRILGGGASAEERQTLGAIRFQDNRAVLHTDSTLLPSQRKVWAAWNYERSPNPAQEDRQVCLHYLINQLQPLPFADPVIVSLNPVRDPREDLVLRQFSYAHPVFDQAALSAQQRLPHLQGQHNTWFCGAWTGYGFHEDGLRSGHEAADNLLRQLGRST